MSVPLTSDQVFQRFDDYDNYSNIGNENVTEKGQTYIKNTYKDMYMGCCFN